MKEKMYFQLSEPLKISKDGGFTETATIEVEPPGMAVFDELTAFQQLFMGSFISAGNLVRGAERDEINPEEEKSAIAKLKENIPSAEDIILMMSMSQEVKLKDIFFNFKKLMFKTAKVDENLRMKEIHFLNMEYEDVLQFIGEYVHFFIFPSLLGGKLEKNNGSAQSAI